MKKNKLVLLGGGGHCKACIDVIEREDKYEIIGILDKSELKGTKVLDYNIIGEDKDIKSYVDLGCSFLITVGQIKSVNKRIELFNLLAQYSAKLAIIKSPNAVISKDSTLGVGTIVMNGAHINPDTYIGMNSIINTGSDIEHDVVIGDHTHISSHVVVNGNSIIGNGVFIGSGSIIINQVSISDKIIVGAGSVVVDSLIDNGIYVGVPAHKIK